MASSSTIREKLDHILPKVQKPGRYVGGEFNLVRKNWDEIQTKIALVFPDIYDIGIPNLGIAILYDQINQRKDALAERAYLPWVDMEREMRLSEIPLYTLESLRPLTNFDVVGFSLPYETLYTNVLNALDLAGIPLFSRDRNDQHPLVIAGGHACFNPEPMSAFFDAFVIGEGEEIIHEIITCFTDWKAARLPRKKLLEALVKIPGIYVPEFYRVDQSPDGMITQVSPLVENAPLPIYKRIVVKLPPPVTNFLVPAIDVVQDRVAIEIMRGCSRSCRFCQAGIITRPVRERSVEEIVEAIETAISQTGYEDVALLSLSSSDYTHIRELVRAVRERLNGKHLTLSLPSLRIESFSVDLMEELKCLRPGGGFTLAPEAATERMRQIINKPVSTDQLLQTAREIFSHGWSTIKLYFMIGHPSETLEDVRAIVQVCKDVVKVGRRIIGGRAKVNVGISTFIPKPHTPFQWVSCDQVDQIELKQSILKNELRGSSFKLTWVEPQVTLLEAWLSRGDRRLSSVIYQAWKNGAKFDAWQDQFNFKIWETAFSEANLDPYFFSHRQRDLQEILPWQHISTAVRPSYLKQDYLWSLEGKTREDCSTQCFACGILPHFSDLRFKTVDAMWKCPESPVKVEREHA
jgi:radical SAM family uncharacterized protein